jgi:hypothetical protein
VAKCSYAKFLEPFNPKGEKNFFHTPENSCQRKTRLYIRKDLNLAALTLSHLQKQVMGKI